MLLIHRTYACAAYNASLIKDMHEMSQDATQRVDSTAMRRTDKAIQWADMLMHRTVSHMTTHSRSGRLLCLPFSRTSPGSLLLLLNLSFFSFLLLLRVRPVSFFSFTGLRIADSFSVLGTFWTIMIGSSAGAVSVMVSLSLLPRPVSLDRVSDSLFSPLGLLGRLLFDPKIREPRRDADRKPPFDSSGDHEMRF
jgi:hypothetical protein